MGREEAARWVPVTSVGIDLPSVAILFWMDQSVCHCSRNQELTLLKLDICGEEKQQFLRARWLIRFLIAMRYCDGKAKRASIHVT